MTDPTPLVTASRDALAEALADAIYPPRDDKPHLLSVFVLAHRVADALLASGVVRAVGGLAEDEALAIEVWERLPMTAPVREYDVPFVLTALAAALATPTDPSEA